MVDACKPRGTVLAVAFGLVTVIMFDVMDGWAADGGEAPANGLPRMPSCNRLMLLKNASTLSLL